MNDHAKEVCCSIIIYSLYGMFFVLIVLTVVVPVYRLVILGQAGAFDLNLLTIVGTVTGFLSMVLAVIFQVSSTESNKRVEATIKNINDTLISVKTLAEVIDNRQNAMAVAASPLSGLSSQKPNKTWVEDSSK